MARRRRPATKTITAIIQSFNGSPSSLAPGRGPAGTKNIDKRIKNLSWGQNVYSKSHAILAQRVTHGLYLFEKQTSTTFPELRFIFYSKFHLEFFHSQDFRINYPYGLYIFSTTWILKTLLLELSRFPGLSRIWSLFPSISSPRKCHNKI